PEPEPDPVELDLERLVAIWPAAVDAVTAQNAMVGALLGEARPAEIEGDRLVVAFPEDASFSKKKAESNRELLHGALRSLTGCSLTVVYELNGEVAAPASRLLAEDELLARLKGEFDAEEVFEDEPEEGD
ncbi:MAG: hypothetical protein H0V85_02975, partial [Thermoleophilaceae bacterium]|nr:hypothetical protein [Thermoleophilaceae bacterium]